MQRDLDDMRASAKKRFRHLRLGACTYCGKYIKCNMYRHVSNYRLDLGQLWRCTVPYGKARHGKARYGKARHKTVWTMSGEHTMSHRMLKLSAWTDSSRPGLFGVRFGPMPFDRATRVSRQMCSCSARSTCLWCITTGCFVGGYPILFSDGTTWNVCKSSYCSRRPCSNDQQCTLPSPAPGSSGPWGNPRPRDGEAGSPKKAWQFDGTKA